MCHLYSSTSPSLYETTTRSVRIEGAVTSIRLENHFWNIIDDIAESEESSTPKFLSDLYREVVIRRGETGNFASLLRVVCTVYLEKITTT